jgi:lysophospholipase L1-like esterase
MVSKMNIRPTMTRILTAILVLHALASPIHAQDINSLAGKRAIILGDSITQDGLYVGYTAYYLNRLHPEKDFDITGLGLSSETLSGLSEEGHAGGRFPRPCLFERLGRLLEKAKPEVVFACYGINDGIYLPLDGKRFAAFRDGVNRLVSQCKAAGVREIFLITPPIHDSPSDARSGYDAVMAAYTAWQVSLRIPEVHVIDLHTAMRKERDTRREPLSKDLVHPGDEGHLLMAKTILGAIGVKAPDEKPAAIKADPLFEKVNRLRQERSTGWMRHIGYTREKIVPPQPLGDTETRAATLQQEIDGIRRGRKATSAK